jgi:hypothetical protein
MIWLLLPVGVYVLFYAMGMLLAFLVRLTPGVKRKVKLARLIVRWFARGENKFMLAKEVEWRLRARYGKSDERAAYLLLLKRLK